MIWKRHPHPWVGAWIVGWMGGSVGQWVVSGHIAKYQINLDLIAIMKMAAPIGGIPGNSQWCHTCTCMHPCVCAYVWGYPLATTHPQPPTPQGGLWNQSKFNSTWTNRDISILFEDLKSVETSPPMGGCIVWWVGGWVGSGQNTKNFKNVDWIKIIQFCLKIYDL